MSLMKDYKGRAGALLRGLAAGVTAAGCVAVAADEDASLLEVGETTYGALAEIILEPQQSSDGARAFLRHREPVVLSLEETSQMTGNRNLTVQVQRQRRAVAGARRIQSESVFDPVFVYSTNYFRPNTFDRDAVVQRVRESEVDFDRLEAEFAAIAAGQPRPDTEEVCVIIDGVLVNGDSCTEQNEFSSRKEFASFDTGPFWSVTGGINASKLFRWGGVASVDYASKYTYKTFHTFGLLATPFDPDDPLGRGSRFGWTSNASVSLSMPLPFTRNFGEYGSQTNVNLKIADLAYTRSDWDAMAALNDRVGASQVSYWQLVAAAATLHATVEQRRLIEDIAVKVRRRYDERLATEYDRMQAEERLQRVLETEELAWSAYLQASNDLVQLLDLDGDLLIIPQEFETSLEATHSVDASRVIDSAMSNRAEIRSAEQALESAQVARRHATAQARPDISLVLSWTFSQTDTAVGYKRFTGSVANIIDPDSDDLFVGVFYRRPLGNVALKAARDRAGYLHSQARFTLDQQRISVADEVNRAVADLLSNEAQVKLTKANADLALQAHERAQRLRTQGVVSEFELLNTYQELLNARVAHVQAQARYQQSYADLQRAQGLLGSRYDVL